MMILDWIQKKRKQPITKYDTTQGVNCIRLTTPSAVGHYKPQSTAKISSGLRFPYPECDDDTFRGFITKDESAEFKDVSTVCSSILFHGFLTIGTLGLEPIYDHSEVETHPETVAEFQLNEADEHSVAVESNGFYGTVAYGGENNDDHLKPPLQVYLSGLPFQVPVPEEETVKNKEARAILKTTDMSNQTPKAKRKPKLSHHWKFHFFTNMMIKDPTISKIQKPLKAESITRKVNKILKSLCKKAYPETAQKLVYANNSHDRTKDSEDDKFHAHNVTPACPNMNLPTSEVIQRKRIIKCIQQCFGRAVSWETGEGERWIRTDQDFLVLELQRKIIIGGQFRDI